MLSAEKEGDCKDSSSFVTYKDKFYEALPFYISIGMTPDEFWCGDPLLVIYYRRANKLKNERKNSELWMQGAYVYEAICKAHPLFQLYAPEGTTALPYSSEPYCLNKKELEKRQRDIEEKNNKKALDMMEVFMTLNNLKYKDENENSGGEDNAE